MRPANASSDIPLVSGSGRARALAFAYFALCAYFLWPVLSSGLRGGTDDWDQLLFYHAAVFKSVYEYGALPFWNPWYCGGDVLWQNPQVALVSPTYLLALLMPLTVAAKLNLALHYAIGFAGMHMLLTRVFRLRYWPLILFLASMFTLGGGAALHLAVGHLTFLPYFYLPWILLTYLRSIETRAMRWVVTGAAIVALALYAGSVQLMVMTLVGLGCFSVSASVLRRDWRPLASLVVLAVFAALFAAPKLLPMVRFVSNPLTVDKRTMLSEPVLSWNLVMIMFIEPLQHRALRLGGLPYGWHEYGNFIDSFGALVAVAAFISLLSDRPWRREHWLGVSLTLTAVLLFAFIFGDFGRLAPYALLQRIPLVSSLRVPSRFSLPLLLFASAAIAAAASDVDPGRLGRAGRVASIVFVLATCFLAVRNGSSFDGAFEGAPANLRFNWLSRPGAPTLDATTNSLEQDAAMLRALSTNAAILKCYEPLQIAGTIAAEEQVIFPEGGARLADVRFGPNQIRFVAQAGQPGRIVLNQHYIDGWRAEGPALKIDRESGRAYVDVPAGGLRGAFSFAPPGLASGFFLMAIGVVLAAVSWRWRLAV